MAKYNETSEHGFKTFSKDLREGIFSSVIFLYGVEEYLIEWAVKSLVKKFVSPGMEAMDFVKLDDENYTPDDIIEACNTFSMVSEKRVVWAKEYGSLYKTPQKVVSEKEIQKISDYMSDPNEGSILVFSACGVKNDPKDRTEKKSELTKLLLGTAGLYDFGSLDKKSLSAFIQKRLKTQNISISPGNLAYLIDETGYFNKESDYRIFNLENDIKKIIAHSNGNEIVEDDISSVITGDKDTFVFDFLDFVLQNKKDKAFALLHNLLAQDGDVFGVLAALVNHFELMLEVKEAREDGLGLVEITKMLGIHEFRVKKAMASCDRFSAEKIRDTLCRLYDVDKNVKSGDMDGAVALELILARI